MVKAGGRRIFVVETGHQNRDNFYHLFRVFKVITPSPSHSPTSHHIYFSLSYLTLYSFTGYQQSVHSKNTVPVLVHTLKTGDLTLSKKKPVTRGSGVPTVMSGTVYGEKIFFLTYQISNYQKTFREEFFWSNVGEWGRLPYIASESISFGVCPSIAVATRIYNLCLGSSK